MHKKAKPKRRFPWILLIVFVIVVGLTGSGPWILTLFLGLGAGIGAQVGVWRVFRKPAIETNVVELPRESYIPDDEE